MADVVQYRLERMVHELEDLERRGIFTHAEIVEIVKQRRKFEYRLKRPSPLKEDFLAYIEYETQLDSLRRLRKKSLTRGGAKRKRKSVSDFAGVARIVEIYSMAVLKYKGDIDLWFRYLEFCRQRRNGRMKKALAQVIRFHPKVPGLWIYAAAWEFDHNLNVAAARALMQNGLRVCPTSEDLWVEYLRMELTYLNKLKARKVALGEDKGSLVRDDEKEWKDENQDLFMSLDGETRNYDKSNVENEAGDLFREQGSNILQTIYSGAVEALPSSFSLRKRFLEILEATDLAHSEELRKEMLSDIKRVFLKDPEYWDWLARLEMSDSLNSQKIDGDVIGSQVQKAIKVYEEAVEALPSGMMFDLYIKFLMTVISSRNGETEVLGLASHTADYITHLEEVYERIETTGCMTEDLACKYISFYLQLGRLQDARQLAEKLCCRKFLDSVELWLLRASIEVRCLSRKLPSSSEADMQSMFELLKGVLTKVPISEAENLWLMVLKLFMNKRKYFDKLVEVSFVSIVKNRDNDNGFSLSSAITDIVLQKDGLQHAREIYKRFLALPHPGLMLYRNCIEMETSLASVGDKDCLVNARKLYEAALASFNQNVSLWRDYHAMEAKLGTSETATAVYWRARKILKDSSAFIASSDLT